MNSSASAAEAVRQTALLQRSILREPFTKSPWNVYSADTAWISARQQRFTTALSLKKYQSEKENINHIRERKNEILNDRTVSEDEMEAVSGGEEM